MCCQPNDHLLISYTRRQQKRSQNLILETEKCTSEIFYKLCWRLPIDSECIRDFSKTTWALFLFCRVFEEGNQSYARAWRHFINVWPMLQYSQNKSKFDSGEKGGLVSEIIFSTLFYTMWHLLPPHSEATISCLDLVTGILCTRMLERKTLQNYFSFTKNRLPMHGKNFTIRSCQDLPCFFAARISPRGGLFRKPLEPG